MKRVIKFALIMNNGKEVRTIYELRENFNLERITEYYLEGKLKTWLQHRNCIEELSRLEKLQFCDDMNEIPSMLCKIFNMKQLSDINISEIEQRRSRLSILKSFSDSEEWEKKLAFIAFTQEELEKKLLYGELCNILDDKMNLQSREVYLCGEMFTISDKFKNITYVGVNTPLVNIKSNNVFDAKANNIKFENVKITAIEKIELDIKECKSCVIDYSKIILKSRTNVKYCKTFINDCQKSIVVDNTGNIHIFGIAPNGEKYIPKFEAPIIDIDFTTALVVAVDMNGKVYQWGSKYGVSEVPNKLPKIKQVTVSSGIVVVLDEFGKIHWWSLVVAHNYFNFITGKSRYGDQVAKPMPSISSKIVQIICKSDIMIALDEKGKVYIWGKAKDDNPILNIPKSLPSIKKIVFLDYQNTILALDENGKLHSWGKGNDNTSDIPENLPYITDISELRPYAFSAMDESGTVHIWGEADSRCHNKLKRIPKLKYLSGIGGISENGNIYSCTYVFPQHDGIKDCDEPQFDGLKAMLPIR
ncbi:MAG: hypothetical protein Q8936_19570 [Bacillota bacterium]|nr:hypothetical protein [Bacillota bacterium]